MHGIDGRTDVDSVRLQALSLGGDDDPITLGPLSLTAQPAPRLLQVSRKDYGVLATNLPERCRSLLHIEIEELLHPAGDPLAAEGAHRRRQVEIGMKGRSPSRSNGFDLLFGAVFGVRQMIRDMDVPIRERAFDRLQPLPDPRFP